MLYAFMLFAQDAPGKEAVSPAGPPNILFPLLVVMAMFFLIIVLPANRREKKQREELMSRLKKNDEVVTSSGIIGVVTSIKEGADEVTLRSDETRLRVLRSSIARILTKSPDEAGPK